MKKLNSFMKTFLATLAFLVPAVALAYTVSLSVPDGGGTVTYGNSTGGVITASQSGLSNIFIRANPASGKTFAGWSGSLSGKPATINEAIPSNISAIATFSNAPTAIMSINNKCIIRILNFNISTARPENGQQVVKTKAQIYVFEDSSFDFAVQDGTGYLASSPNQSFYYAYNAGTVGAGTYLGSNAAFVGNTRYLSMGSATLVSDVRYNCASSVVRYGVTFTSNLPPSVSATLSGAGTYNAHSRVTLTAGTPTNYKLTAFTGTVGNTAILYTVNSTALSNSYTLEDLTGYADIQAYYQYVPPESNRKFTLTLTADPNCSVYINGSGGGVVSLTVNAGTQLTVSAVPDSGYNFYGWSDAFAGFASSFNITMDRDYNSLASCASQSIVAGTGNDGNIAPSLTINASPVDGAGFLMREAYSYSFPAIWGGGSGYLYNSDFVGMPTPVANDGWRFTGWTGNLASSTMTKIKNGTSWRAVELNGITDPQITANYIFDGTEQTNGGVQFEEEVAVSPGAILTENVYTSPVRYDGTLNKSPYTIDGKCVTQVTVFKAQRASNALTGLFAGEYTYTLYALAGADLSVTRSGRFYTFKSDPSNFLLRNSDTPLPGGDYTSDQIGEGFGAGKIFIGSDNMFTFRSTNDDGSLTLLSNDGFSCTAGFNDSATFAPGYVASFPGDPYSVSGYSYLNLFGSNSLVNVQTYDDITATSSSRHIIPGYDNTDKVKHAYRRVDCEKPLDGLNRLGVYCATTFKTSVFWKYDYGWVFATKPAKYFYHQQLANPREVLNNGATPVYGLMVFTADKAVKVMGATSTEVDSITDDDFSSNIPTSAVSRNDVPRYATRISFKSCKWYASARDFFDDETDYTDCYNLPLYDLGDNGTLSVEPFSPGTLNISEPLKLNGLMMNTDRDYEGDYLFYGMYLTSSGQFNVKENQDLAKMFAGLRVDDISKAFLLADITPNVTSLSEVVTDYTNYIATSTTPGYYETIPGHYEPYYFATSTVTDTIAYYSGTTCSGSGSYTCSYTASTSPHSVIFAIATGNNSGQPSGLSFNGDSFTNFSTITNDQGYPTKLWLLADPDDGTHNISVSGSGNTKIAVVEYTGVHQTNLPAVFGSSSSGRSGDRSGSVTTNVDGSYVVAAAYWEGASGDTPVGGTNTTVRAGYGGSFSSGGHIAWADRNAVTASSSTSVTLTISPYSSNDWGVMKAYSLAPATTIIPGYLGEIYVATSTIYHATTTTNGYYATTTRDVYTISTSTLSRNGVRLFTFGDDTYSASFNSSLGYTSLAEMESKLNTRFSITQCGVNTLNFISNFTCLIKNTVMSTLVWIFIPSAESFKSLNVSLNEIVSDTGSPVSLIFSVPLRASNYSDLDWKPATSTQLTLGISTSTRAVVLQPSASSTAAYSAIDYKMKQWVDMGMALFTSIMVSMMALTLLMS